MLVVPLFLFFMIGGTIRHFTDTTPKTRGMGGTSNIDKGLESLNELVNKNPASLLEVETLDLPSECIKTKNSPPRLRALTSHDLCAKNLARVFLNGIFTYRT